MKDLLNEERYCYKTHIHILSIKSSAYPLLSIVKPLYGLLLHIYKEILVLPYKIIQESYAPINKATHTDMFLYKLNFLINFYFLEIIFPFSTTYKSSLEFFFY